MSKRMNFAIIAVLLLLLAATPMLAFGKTTSNGGITLTFPDDMTDCSPTFHFATTGVDPSWDVQWNLWLAEGNALVENIASRTATGDLDFSLTPEPLETGESQEYAIFVAVFVPGQELPTKLSGKWTVDCEKDDNGGGGEGCTPGYWKNHPEAWSIPTGTDFDTTFGRDAFNPDISMMEALNLKGGHLNALSRHAAAAYLNAHSADVDYDLTTADVVSAFQEAFDSGDFETIKDMFEWYNEQGCPN